MADLEEVRQSFTIDDSQWQAGIDRIEASVVSVGDKVDTGLSKVGASVAQLGDDVKQTAQVVEQAAARFSFEQAAQAGERALGAIVNGLEGFRAEISRAGEDADDLRDRLKGVFGDAADSVAALVEKQIVIGVDVRQAEQAAVTLNKFGALTEQNLLRVENAAAGTGRSIDSFAQKLGKLTEATDQKGLRAAINGLSNDLGVSTKQLEAQGAVLDANNKVLLDTPARMEAARQAMLRFVDVKFEGAAARAADETTRLKGEMELLKREVGASVVEFKEGFSPALRGVVADLRSFPPEIKTIIGLGGEFVSIGAQMASGALQIGTNLVLLGQNATVAAAATNALSVSMTGLRAAMAFLAGPAGLVFALGTGLALAVNELNKATIATEQLAQAELRRTSNAEHNSKFIDKTAEQVRALGGDSKQVAHLIDNLQEQASAAREKGQFRLSGQLEEQIKRANAVKAELATAEAKAREPVAADVGDKNAPSAKEQDKLDREAEKARKARLADELADIKLQASLHKGNHQAEIDGLKRVLQTFDLTHKEKAQISIQIANLEEKVNKDKNAAIEKDRKATVQTALDDIRNQAAAHIISKDQEIQGLRQVLNQYKLNAAEKTKIINQIAALEGQVANETAAKARKAKAEADRDAAKAKAAEKKDDTQAKVDEGKVRELAKEAITAQEKEIDVQIQRLEEQAASGKNTLPALKALLDQRLALVISEINAERDAAIKSTSNENVKAAAITASEAKIKTARAESTKQYEDEVEKQKKALKSLTDAQDQAAGKKRGASSEFGGGVISLEEMAAQLSEDFGKGQTSRFATPSIVAPTAKAGTVAASPFADRNSQTTVAADPKATTKTQTAPADEQAKSIASAITEALKAAPTSITIQVTTDGQTESQTFAGPAEKLAQQSNVFNGHHTLGKP